MSERGRRWECAGTHSGKPGCWALTRPRLSPTEQEVRFRPADWPLPRPAAIHHIVEDFLTDWTAPLSHILPLRRFLENCLGTDLRSFYAGSVRSRRTAGLS